MDWQNNKQIELKYRTSLQKIGKKIIEACKGLQTIDEINIALSQVYKSKMFQNLANTTASRFITNANLIDSKTWREASRANGKSKQIYEALQKTLGNHIGTAINQQVLNNANLIKTLPLSLSKQITNYVSTEAYAGTRASETAKVLEGKIFQYTHAKATVIARTETSKAMTALTEARSKDVGVKFYIWKTANDGQRVRASHRNMQGVIVAFDDPPSPEQLVNEKNVGKYNAGNIYNCRCFCRPVIVLDTIKFPCRVYYKGSIIKMTKEQFKSIM